MRTVPADSEQKLHRQRLCKALQEKELLNSLIIGKLSSVAFIKGPVGTFKATCFKILLLKYVLLSLARFDTN